MKIIVNYQGKYYDGTMRGDYTATICTNLHDMTIITVKQCSKCLIWFEDEDMIDGQCEDCVGYKRIEILFHSIKYRFNDGRIIEVGDTNYEHIVHCITNLCKCGNFINHDSGVNVSFGWWEIG